MLKQPPPLDDASIQELLQLAAAGVDAALRDVDPPQFESERESLQRGGGAFVTLSRHGQLRGCIGTIAAAPPLWHTVLSMARSATLEDERFERLDDSERDGLRVELSLLGEPFPIDAADVELGVHGLILDRGGVRALLLPQVAIEHDLNRDEFLDALCRKAKLPAGAWKDGDVRLWGFRTQSAGATLDALLSS